jgi:hypothetical protein
MYVYVYVRAGGEKKRGRPRARRSIQLHVRTIDRFASQIKEAEKEGKMSTGWVFRTYIKVRRRRGRRTGSK